MDRNKEPMYNSVSESPTDCMHSDYKWMKSPSDKKTKNVSRGLTPSTVALGYNQDNSNNDSQDELEEDDELKISSMDPIRTSWVKPEPILLRDSLVTVDEKEEEDTDIDEYNDELEATGRCLSSYRNDDFFAESPYFDAVLDSEMHALNVNSETMNEIAAKTEDFANCGKEMVKATRQLASSLKISEKVKSKRKVMEPEIVDGLERLGDVLDEIASTQERMSRYFGSLVVSKIRSIFAENGDTLRMRDEAESKTDEAEELFAKYFHGGENSWGNLDLDFGKQLDKNTSPVVQKASQVSRWKRDLVRIRALEMFAELRRYQLAENVGDSKYQQNVDISKCATDMVGELHSYFSHCSKLVKGLMHRTTYMKAKCEEIQVKHQNRRWKGRENIFNNNLLLARQTEMAYGHEAMKVFYTPEAMLDQSYCVFDLREESNQLWDVPATLASYSGHRRATAKGVLAEGWLYRRENTSRLLMTITWTRSWFLVRKNGLFKIQYERKCDQDDSIEVNMKKIKVCDLQVCTVRQSKEIREDPSTRFCFELITPSNTLRQLVFKARGPHELKMWLDGIRSGISSQLATGDAAALQRYQNPLQLNSIWDSVLTGRMISTKSSTRSSTRNSRRFSGMISLFSSHEFLESENDLIQHEVRDLMKANPTCADCGNGSPDWVSLNLGVIICLECSGVHRSLGVHISKVRSLTLDSLSDRESRLLLSLGNACLNQFWEKEATCDFEKRKADRKNWIRRKYVKKEFIGTDMDFPEGSEIDACKSLYDASRKADVIGVAKAMIYGGKVDWENPWEDSKTALEVCGIDVQNEDRKVRECEELLIQNGAKRRNGSDEKDDGEINSTKAVTPPKRFSFRSFRLKPAFQELEEE